MNGSLHSGRCAARRRSSHGFTLIELMVALVLTLLVVLVAAAALQVARHGH